MIFTYFKLHFLSCGSIMVKCGVFGVKDSGSVQILSFPFTRGDLTPLGLIFSH